MSVDETNQHWKELSALVPIVNDFPKPGVNFRNIAPLFRDIKIRNWVIDKLTQHCLTIPIDVVVGIDARGFLFGLLLADRLKLPFVMARKPSKLPGKTEKIVYHLEYATACLELECDSIQEKQKVLVVDDILATGGSILAVCDLVQRMGATVSGICCMASIEGLGGLQKIKKQTGVDSFCLLEFQPTEMKEEQSLTNPIPRPIDNGLKPIFTVLYHPTMSGLAKVFHQTYPQLFELGHISWDLFPDGFANIHFPGNLAGKRVVFLASLYEKYSYMDQLSVMAVLPRQLIQSLDIMLPYYAPGTMERVETPGTLATADTYAQITSRVFPLTKEGPPVLSIYDLHNNTTRFSFSNNVCFQPLSAVPRILEEINDMCQGLNFCPCQATTCYKRQKSNGDYWTVVFPDEGSYKRFRGLVPVGTNMVVCGKIRDGEKRTVTIMEKIPHTMDLTTLEHAVIVDDLVQTGGTIFECYQALKRAGVKRVSAYCTHAVFPRREYLHFFHGGKWGGLENFWITDSIPKNADLLKGHAPFKIISLGPSMIKNIASRYPGNPIISSPMKVILTSNNADKKNAVLAAFQTIFPLHKIEVVSQVNQVKANPSQPKGLSETTQCAQNRLECTPLDQSDFVVSIENGIDPKSGVDFAVVIVHKGVASSRICVSEHVKIDDDVLEEYQKRCEAESNLTVGDIYKKRNGYDNSNWHVHVSGKSRLFLMKNTIMSAVMLLQ